MAIRKRKKSKAAHKRTKKVGKQKRRLRAALLRRGLTHAEMKRYDQVLEHQLKGLLSPRELKASRTYHLPYRKGKGSQAEMAKHMRDQRAIAAALDLERK
jgi:hypothetical protein